MDKIAKRLKAYIDTHPFDPGDSDCETVLDLTVFEGENEPFVMDIENPLFGSSTCGVYWSAYSLTSGNEEPIEILIQNPHRFGNETAIDEMLSNTALWTDIAFEKEVLESGKTQRNMGLLFVIISFIVLGTALFSTLIHIKNSKIIWLFGIVILFASAYLSYSADGVSFWSESVVSNTTILGCSIHDAATEVERICNAYNSLDIDCTVLLTHIGFEEDKQLASQLDPSLGVDIIIGGHSHTYLEQPEEVNGILIAQAGTGTDQIGRFDLEINTDTNSICSFSWESIPITDEHCPRDTALEAILNPYKLQAEIKYSRVVTRLKRQLTHPSWYQETELGGFLADILRESLRLDMMLVGSGSIRVTELGPIILFSNLTECLPYDDAAIALWVTGAQLKKMILYMLRNEVWDGAHCEFFQFSEGVRVVYDKENHAFKEFSLHEEPIADEKIYKIGLQYYFYLNMKDFFSISHEEVEKNGKPRKVATSCREVLDEYLSCHQNLDHKISGRLKVE